MTMKSELLTPTNDKKQQWLRLCVWKFTSSCWHDEWGDLQTIMKVETLPSGSGRMGKKEVSLSISVWLSCILTSFPHHCISLCAFIFACVRQVEGWLAGWWSEIQQLWVEIGSYCADMWCLTVQEFKIFFLLLPGETTKRHMETKRPGQHINNINNVSGGWVKGAEKGGNCWICFLIDAMHSAWVLQEIRVELVHFYTNTSNKGSDALLRWGHVKEKIFKKRKKKTFARAWRVFQTIKCVVCSDGSTDLVRWRPGIGRL